MPQAQTREITTLRAFFVRVQTVDVDDNTFFRVYEMVTTLGRNLREVRDTVWAFAPEPGMRVVEIINRDNPEYEAIMIIVKTWERVTPDIYAVYYGGGEGGYWGDAYELKPLSAYAPAREEALKLQQKWQKQKLLRELDNLIARLETVKNES